MLDRRTGGEFACLPRAGEKSRRVGRHVLRVRGFGKKKVRPFGEVNQVGTWPRISGICKRPPASHQPAAGVGYGMRQRPCLDDKRTNLQSLPRRELDDGISIIEHAWPV